MSTAVEILVLDDEHQAADLLATLLRSEFDHALVHVVHTGEDAIDAANAHSITVAILDLEMPGIGGERAARALRDLTHKPRPLLIALSGNMLRLGELRTNGPFDVLMNKPVDFYALSATVKSHLAGAST